jgi:hypothetical protein
MDKKKCPECGCEEIRDWGPEHSRCTSEECQYMGLDREFTD